MQNLWDCKMFVQKLNWHLLYTSIQVTIFKCLYCIQLDTFIGYIYYYVYIYYNLLFFSNNLLTFTLSYLHFARWLLAEHWNVLPIDLHSLRIISQAHRYTADNFTNRLTHFLASSNKHHIHFDFIRRLVAYYC